MSMIIEYELEDGSDSIMIDLSDDEPIGGELEISAHDGITGRATKKFESALGMINLVSSKVVKTLGETVNKPNEITVEFGVKFSAGAGALLAKAGTEAHLNVTLVWKK